MRSSDVDQKLAALKRHVHCCNCGAIDPETGNYSGEDEGFTVCCSEAVCRREHRYFFGDETHQVEACCWARAELEFLKAGIDASAMKGIRRTLID